MGRGIALLRGPGRAAAVTLVAVALVLRIIDPGFITEFRVQSFDLLERVWPRAGDSARVAIIDIDEKSLARYGQWPWPWHRIAKLVHRIAQGNPRVLGIDVVFSEPDRLSPDEIARELPGLPPAVTDALAQLPPSNRDLAEAMAAVPTVLALAPSHEEAAPDSDPLRPAPIRQAGDDPRPFLKGYKSLVQSQPDLRAGARAAGEIAVEPDPDGVVRRLALAVTHQQTIVPSFALEVLRVAGDERSIVIDTGALGIESFRIGSTIIPTDRQGRAILHFAPSQARSISASDVLDPAFDPAELRGQLVLLGVAGVGITGLRQTPLGLVRAVDLHAELIESILFNALLHRPASLVFVRTRRDTDGRAHDDLAAALRPTGARSRHYPGDHRRLHRPRASIIPVREFCFSTALIRRWSCSPCSVSCWSKTYALLRRPARFCGKASNIISRRP